VDRICTSPELLQNRGVTVTQDERDNIEKHKQVEHIVKFDHQTVPFQLKE